MVTWARALWECRWRAPCKYIYEAAIEASKMPCAATSDGSLDAIMIPAPSIRVSSKHAGDEPDETSLQPWRIVVYHQSPLRGTVIL